MTAPVPNVPVPQRGNVLVVDDDASLRESLAAVLAEEGYSVTTACGVLEGSALLEHHRYDLVIIDYMLGGSSGLDLVRAASIKFPSVSVILITGYPDHPEIVDAQHENHVLVLSKPFDVEHLLAWVKHGVIASGVFRLLRGPRNQDPNA